MLCTTSNGMNTKKIAYLLVFSLVLGFAGVAYGASEDTRYLVKSSSNFWKKSFGVRHEFKEGFTTDLSDWQLRVARMFGIEVVLVKKLFVLPESLSLVGTDGVDGVKGKPTGSSTKPVPSDQIPWGIEAVYGSKLLLDKPSGGVDINIAVLDTGILRTHPDLKNRIKGCKDFTSAKQPIVDNSCDDKNGHGTHVAGTIAARDNEIGVVGVAPEANLYAVKVLDKRGSGSWSSVICGIDWVTGKAGEIKVANMSLGGSGSSDNDCGQTNNDALHQAICKSMNVGITYVVAAGNENDNAANHVPAAYNDAVITISALVDTDGSPGGFGDPTGYGSDDTFASFSNYGDVVDLGAPGVNIYSTWKNGGYNTISGTSMATPHVAGAVALYLKSHPDSLWTQTLFPPAHTFWLKLKNPVGS